jgi:hypothetical protein
VPLVDDVADAVGLSEVSVSAVLPPQPAQIVITAATANTFMMLIRDLLIGHRAIVAPGWPDM